MQLEVQKLAQKIDSLRGLFSKALDLGQQIAGCRDSASISRLTEMRHRIARQSGNLSQECLAELKLLEDEVSPAEKAFLDEQRRLVRDLIPDFHAQENLLNKVLGLRLGEARSGMAQKNRQYNASKAYLRAPGSGLRAA